LQLHLLHVAAGIGRPARSAEVQAALRALVPPDLAERVTCHVARGNAVGTILETAEKLAAGFLIMGEHTRSVLLSLFVRDNARAVLEKAVCPVWYVPRRR
jgi:nucleotide-binding universal stress UspA family protein